MQKRHVLPSFFRVCCLLWLFAGCASGQGLATPTPTAIGGPPFEETTPLVMHPPLFGVNNLIWSPDGKRVAIASADGVFQVWEAATGRLVSTHYDSGRSTKISLLGWTADGKRLLATILGPANTVQVWDAETGNTLVTFSHSYPVAASHDGKYVAVGSGGSVQIWDTSTGQQIATFDTATSHVDSIAWSPDDSLLATTNTASESHLAQVWNAATETQVCTYQNTSPSYIDHLVWSPDNRRIVSISGTGLNGDPVIAQIWSAASCQPIFRLHGAPAQAADLAWSPDGTHIASWESTYAPLQVWDAATGKLSFTIGDMAQFIIFSQAWSPDGKQIVVAGEPLKMQVFDVSTGQPQITYRLTTNQNIVAWSPNFTYGASTQQVYVWGNSPAMCGLDNNCPVSGGSHAALITALAWSPDSKHIASASMDKTVLIYDIANQKNLVIYRGHTEAVTAVAWSPDGKYIASASADKTIQIWDATSGERVLTLRGHTGTVTAVAWSPDSKRVVSGSEDGTVRVWDVIRGEAILTYRGHTGAVMAVAWSPRGRYIASAGEDTTVRVWDANTGKTALVYRGHSDAVLAVEWSPDGKRVASAGADGTIQIW